MRRSFVFLSLILYFCYFVIFSPLWKGQSPCLDRSHSPKDGFYQDWLKLVNRFWSKKYKFCQCIAANLLIFPFGKWWGPLFVQNLNYLTKSAFCRIWLKLGQWFWRIFVYKFVSVFALYRFHFHLKKGGAFLFNKTQWCFVPSLIEIGPVVLEKKMKMSKDYNNDNNGDEQRRNCDQKCLFERTAQVSLKVRLLNIGT